MLRRALTLAALPAAFALSGCAGAPLQQLSDGAPTIDGTVYGAAPCKSPLRACLKQGPGMVNTIRRNGLREAFASAINKAAPSAADCDLLFDAPETFNDSADVYSVRTGRRIVRIIGAYMNVAYGACAATAPGTPGYAAAMGDANAVAAANVVPAGPSPASAAPATAAASAGITKEDLAAAVAAAMKAQQAPAAPAPAAEAPLNAPGYSSPERPDDLAVIVGVESYSDIATKAPYAERDAAAFKAHARALGVPERNIVLLTGSKAVKSALEKNVEGWLPRLAKPDSRVYFYFSGHGAPDVKTGRAYLVPWDGDPNFLDATAYPVSRLYEKLSQLPAKQVLVALDSCFSGAGGRSVLASGARPLVTKLEKAAVPAKLTVLAASASDEISGSLDDKRAGAFTWFLLEGLNMGKRSAKELHAYLTPKVQDEARRLNRDQTPQLLGADASLR